MSRLLLCCLTVAFALSCGPLDDETMFPDQAWTGGKADFFEQMQEMAAATLLSIHADTANHFSSMAATGISPYYGYNSKYAKLSEAGKQAYIAARKVPGTNPPMPQMISCINWVLHHLEVGYTQAGRGDVWEEINRIVVEADRDGTVLMQELKKDGWTAIYWNPDVKRPDDGDPEHPWTYQQVLKGKPYYGTQVDDLLINYRPTAGSPTIRDVSVLSKLQRVPLWAGVANGGYHAFLGVRDQVNESHSTKNPDNVENVEQGPFSALTSPTKKYNSGVILVPPGMWPPPDPPEPTVPSWVGDTCNLDVGCPFSQGLNPARCHDYIDVADQVRGFCTLPCQGYCPDQPGSAETFCIEDPALPHSGMCVSKAEQVNGNCALLPGTQPLYRNRFVGNSSAYPGRALVCVPSI